MKDKFFLIFVFITGASILAVEMVAFKATIPYFGSSIFVWALIIATVMFSLSLGYFFGGRLADKKPEEKLLFIIVTIGGFLVGLISLFQGLFLDILVKSAERNVYDAFPYILLLFAVPVFLLSFSSPFVIRLCNKSTETTGNTTGSVYAFSTIGCVVGIYISSFFLLPVFGSKITLLVLSLVLILISAIGWLKKVECSFKFVIVFSLILAFPFLFYNLSLTEKEGVLYEKESFYGLIQIKEWKEGSLVLDINASGRWSVYHPEKILTEMYFDFFIPFYYLLEERENIDVLIIGHAGGVTSRQFSHYFGERNVNIDGLEIDPLVSKAAKQFFDIDQHKGLNIINQDGRLFLQRTKKQYDLIIADAYTGALYIPFHLATQEFFSLVKSRLKPNGLFVQHLLGNSYEENVPKCISETAESVFPYSYFIDTTRGENIFLGSKTDKEKDLLSLEQETEHEELRELKKVIADKFFKVESGDCILTDNRAPTEMLREIDNWKRSK